MFDSTLSICHSAFAPRQTETQAAMVDALFLRYNPLNTAPSPILFKRVGLGARNASSHYLMEDLVFLISQCMLLSPHKIRCSHINSCSGSTVDFRSLFKSFILWLSVKRKKRKVFCVTMCEFLFLIYFRDVFQVKSFTTLLLHTNVFRC